VVGLVAPDEPALLGLVRAVAAVLCGGSTAVALTSSPRPLAALCLGEVLATSDLPAGVVNLLSGFRPELLPWLAAHMDVNAVDAAGCSPDELRAVEEAAAANVKRVARPDDAGPTPAHAAAFMELKTVWHPVGL
jgi:acyl-CoA reductase-like NAD-dependent aldehyde dehydrogenase